MNVCKRCYVSGRVQGVFFRASARDRAQSLRLTGYAKNLPDGRVEVLACGREPDVNELIEWLGEGPPLAKVEAVEVFDADEKPPATFTTD